MTTGTTKARQVLSGELEAASKNKDYIRLAQSVFRKFDSFRLTADDKRQVFLDALWYTMQRWIPEKAAFQTYLVQNVRYKLLGFLQKRDSKEKTNTNLEVYLLDDEPPPDDFDKIVARLHESMRVPLTQKYVLNMSTAEIAEANGYNKAYAAFLIQKGINKLRKMNL